MKIHFLKMHALGNDFVVTDSIRQNCPIRSAMIPHFADRHFGIGFDQLLIVDKSQSIEVDFICRIYNADGSTGDHCGNGVRCVAKYLQHEGLTTKQVLKIETKSALVCVEMQPGGEIQVDMGVPEFGLLKVGQDDERFLFRKLDVGDGLVMHTVFACLGTPFAVCYQRDLDSLDVEKIGQAIQKHPALPFPVSVLFARIISRSQIQLRSYERGSGEVLSCGTGACVAVACGVVKGSLDQNVKVSMRGGDLHVQWRGIGVKHTLFLTGPAATVFSGDLEL